MSERFFAKIEGGAATDYGLSLYDVRILLPNVSIPENALSIGSYACYERVDPPAITYAEDAIEVAPQKIGGVWRMQWSVVPALDEVVAARIDRQSREVRMKRDALLKRCDWTQIVDSPLSSEDRAAWAAYRQALRNVPEQDGFPWNVTWPSPPSP